MIAAHEHIGVNDRLELVVHILIAFDDHGTLGTPLEEGTFQDPVLVFLDTIVVLSAVVIALHRFSVGVVFWISISRIENCRLRYLDLPLDDHELGSLIVRDLRAATAYLDRFRIKVHVFNQMA